MEENISTGDHRIECPKKSCRPNTTRKKNLQEVQFTVSTINICTFVSTVWRKDLRPESRITIRSQLDWCRLAQILKFSARFLFCAAVPSFTLTISKIENDTSAWEGNFNQRSPAASALQVKIVKRERKERKLRRDLSKALRQDTVGTAMEDLLSLFTTPSVDSTLVNPKKTININLVAQLAVASCICLTSIFLRHFSVVGFQLLITGLGNVLFALGSFWIVNKKPDSLSVGAALGSGVVISFVSLITAVYWGELSRCEVVDVAIRKYTCESKGAMRSLCLFSVMLFFLQVLLTSYSITHLFEFRFLRFCD